MSEDYAVNFQNKGKEVISYGAGKDILWPIEQSCLAVDILSQIDNPQMLAIFKSGFNTTEQRHNILSLVTRWEKEQAMRLQQVVSDIGKLDEKKWQTQILSNLEEKLEKFSWSRTGTRWEGLSTVIDRTSTPLASVTEFV